MHLALQAPPVANGDVQSTVKRRLDGIRDALMADEDTWLHRKHYPLCLSDAATCDVEADLRRHNLHSLVWCALGCGWEQRSDQTTTLSDIVEILREDKRRAPKLAVICLKYGAKKAAQKLLQAGIAQGLNLRIEL